MIDGSKQRSGDKNDLSNLDLDCYDNAKYLSYNWCGNVMYNESAMLVRNQDGSLPPVKLLFPVDEIISVRSADLTKKYVEGTDYIIKDGKLLVLETGNFPVLNYEKMYFEYNPGEASSAATVEGNTNVQAFPTVDGKYELYEEAGILYAHQIAVTYYHSKGNTYTIPPTQSEKFSRLLDKLEKGENVNIACLGDSISNGSSASGFFKKKLKPYMPTYFGMLGEYIQEKYGYPNLYVYEEPSDYETDMETESPRIKMVNFSVGGKDTYWGLTQTGVVAEVQPDVVILGFGMNDGSAYTGADAYYQNIKTMVADIRKSNPLCEFVVVSTTLPNQNICWRVGGSSICGNQEKYLPKLMQLENEEEHVAVVDMTTLHKEYLSVKNYRDMTGNNVNHPNDFLIRLYAQAIVKTIFG